MRTTADCERASEVDSGSLLPDNGPAEKETAERRKGTGRNWRLSPGVLRRASTEEAPIPFLLLADAMRGEAFSSPSRRLRVKWRFRDSLTGEL
jgi:hypothetical protein